MGAATHCKVCDNSHPIGARHKWPNAETVSEMVIEGEPEPVSGVFLNVPLDQISGISAVAQTVYSEPLSDTVISETPAAEHRKRPKKEKTEAVAKYNEYHRIYGQDQRDAKKAGINIKEFRAAKYAPKVKS